VDPGERLGEFGQIGKADRCNAETALFLASHQLLGRQPVKRLAQRRRADLVALAERIEAQTLSRPKRTAQDLAAQPGVDRCREGVRAVHNAVLALSAPNLSAP